MWVWHSAFHQPPPPRASTRHLIPFPACQPPAQLSRQCSNIASSQKPSLERRLSNKASLLCPHGTLRCWHVMLTAVWGLVISPLFRWTVSGSQWRVAWGVVWFMFVDRWLMGGKRECVAVCRIRKGRGSVYNTLHAELNGKRLQKIRWLKIDPWWQSWCWSKWWTKI